MRTVQAFALAALLSACPAAIAAPAAVLPLDAANGPLRIAVNEATRGAATLRAQVLLERAHFSPGEIDALPGQNLRAAVAGFQVRNKLRPSGVVDRPTWALLDRDTAPVLVNYTVTEADAAGPYQPIPEDMMQKSALPALGYASAAEALGERFHASPTLLQQLNPGKDLGRAGEQLRVPNVEGADTLPRGSEVVVDKSASTVALLDEHGVTVAQFPASVGSQHDPLPIGRWKIKGVARNPSFHYNPQLFWDADSGDGKAVIAPGPNNPVGVVWIDLTKDHYGIHGTPEPGAIRRTQSHGCIRMTNWSAQALADAVRPGMPALLRP